MKRRIVIKVGSKIIKGLVSPGELPEVVSSFFRMAKEHGAIADFLGEGTFIAEKASTRLTLMIGDYHEAIPSRLLIDALSDAMEACFLFVG